MGIKQWLFSFALKKAAVTLVKVTMASLIAVGPLLQAQGIKIELNENLLVASVIGLTASVFEIVRNYLKHKLNLSFL